MEAPENWKPLPSSHGVRNGPGTGTWGLTLNMCVSNAGHTWAHSIHASISFFIVHPTASSKSSLTSASDEQKERLGGKIRWWSSHSL